MGANTRLRVLVAGVVALLAVTVTAQDTAAPTLAAEALLRLQNFELRAENIALKQAQLQADLAALQAEANDYAQTLKRPGYTLTRNERGAWSYAPTKATKP
jgi:hypothetical protein